jgi:hypothetical protein
MSDTILRPIVDADPAVESSGSLVELLDLYRGVLPPARL